MHKKPYPFSDLNLARLLERTEAATNAAFVEARGRLEPQLGAAWRDIAGVYAMFDGPGSPLTQTFGLGLFDTVGDAEFARLESFFLERNAPLFHEVSPLISAQTLDQLNRRGYQPVEYSNVLVRPLDEHSEPSESIIHVRRVALAEAALWSRVAADGWTTESPEIADFIEKLGFMSVHAQGMNCFVAEVDNSPVGTAALSICGDVALLAGASTVATHRNRGIQRALLEARLHFAAAHKATLAMVVAQPGSSSQRNAERQGFRVAYTRTKWQLKKMESPCT